MVLGSMDCFAAGSWATLANRDGYLEGAFNKPIGIAREFTADASAATIPAYAIGSLSGFITAIDVEFDAVAPPNSATVTVSTANGIAVISGSALTASGRITLSSPVPVAGGFIITVTGNTTNSAKAKVVVYVM